MVAAQVAPEVRAVLVAPEVRVPALAALGGLRAVPAPPVLAVMKPDPADPLPGDPMALPARVPVTVLVAGAAAAVLRRNT